MQDRIKRGNVEQIKEKLRNFKRKEIEFNEPHFTLKLERLKIR